MIRGCLPLYDLYLDGVGSMKTYHPEKLCVHFVFHTVILFWFILINEIGPNEQCSKINYFNRTEAGLTSKWGRILPVVQWCYQNQFICPL